MPLQYKANPPTMGLLSVLPSCLQVVKQSQYVHLDTATISTLLDNNSQLEIPPLTPGPAPYHFFDHTAVTAEWLFVLDTINHCFWPDVNSPPWTIYYKGEELSGYWALAACLKRAMEDGISINKAETLASINSQTLAHIFAGRGRIPLFEERLANLRQIGQVLVDSFQGSFIHVLEEAGGSPSTLVSLLVSQFPSFNDIASYSGQIVSFFKRAQLLIYDLWCTFSGESWGSFADLWQLTAFADYKLPQVLRHLGIIHYSPSLAERIQNLVHIPPGSAAEVEIRATTIWAVEHLRQELGRRGQKVTSAQIDNWLWNLGQEDTYRSSPYHRTRTIFY